MEEAAAHVPGYRDCEAAQDDPPGWEIEGAKMSNVYQNAMVTIAGAD